jgi:hypothetical protein
MTDAECFDYLEKHMIAISVSEEEGEPRGWDFYMILEGGNQVAGRATNLRDIVRLSTEYYKKSIAH